MAIDQAAVDAVLKQLFGEKWETASPMEKFGAREQVLPILNAAVACGWAHPVTESDEEAW